MTTQLPGCHVMVLPDLRQKECPHSGCLQATSKPEGCGGLQILGWHSHPWLQKEVCHANGNCSNPH